MLATQGGDPDEIIQGVINCINDHLKTETIRAEDLPQCEAELLLLLMRAKSVGEVIDVRISDPDNEEVVYEHKVDLSDIKIDIDPDFSDKIVFSTGEMVEFRLPGLRTLEGLDEDMGEFDQSIEILSRCLQSVVVGEEVFAKVDLKESEIKDFFLDLEQGEFQKIVNSFLLKIPKLIHKTTIEREDGSTFEAEVTGLASFL